MPSIYAVNSGVFPKMMLKYGQEYFWEPLVGEQPSIQNKATPLVQKVTQLVMLEYFKG